MNEKSCFCVPIHKPDFNFLEENERSEGLIPSFLKHFKQEKLFLVFSNNQEADECYQNIISKYNTTQVESIIFNHNFLNTHGSHNGIVTRKKFFGVKYILENYDYEYVAVVDKDVEFIKYQNIDIYFDNFYNSKLVYSTCSKNRVIKNISNSIFTKHYFNNIPNLNEVKNIINNDDGSVNYFWFNNIPIYKRSFFNMFYERIKNIDIIDWNIFDFNLYMYFLISINEFKLYKLKENLQEKYLYTNESLLEEQGAVKNFELYFNLLKPGWLKHPILINTNVYPEPVFLRFHVDR